MRITESTPEAAKVLWDQLPEWAMKKINDGLMVTVVCKINPTTAEKLLAGNIHNRSIKNGVVMEVARAIREGAWKLTHQGIAFSSDSILLDGQNRLWGVVEAGKQITINITFNEPMENQKYIDTGCTRSNVDILRLSGFDWISPREAGIVKILAKGTGSHKPRTDELIQTLVKYEEGIRFVKTCCASTARGTTRAPALTPVVRAYYLKKDKERLKEFVCVLVSGLSNGPQDSAVILLRNYLLENLDTNKGSVHSEAVYRKAENALDHFLNRHAIKYLKEATVELFPFKD